MPRFRRLLIWLMAALWLPATLHCAMDRAGLFESAPGCCAHNEKETAGDQTCNERCASFDRGITKTSSENLGLNAPILVAVMDWLVPLAPTLDLTVEPSGERAEAPLELARTWHFVARAALSPRAPSFAS